jgi:hypothetical protein
MLRVLVRRAAAAVVTCRGSGRRDRGSNIGCNDRVCIVTLSFIKLPGSGTVAPGPPLAAGVLITPAPAAR